MALRTRFGWYEWVTVALAAVIVGFGVAQAIWEHSWQPIWTVAVIPAALVAALGTRTAGRCGPRSRRSDR
jgi:hypothetical protein